jgi:hypothetical protein
MPDVAVRAEYHVELGVLDENMLADIRRAMARELRRRVGSDVHVQVTFDFEVPRPPEPAPPPEPKLREPTYAETFRTQRAFWARRA